MRLLLDTHTLVWSALDPAQLSEQGRALIEDSVHEIFVSAVSAMEITTKVRKGTFETARPLTRRFTEQLQEWGFKPLAISTDHAELAGNLDIQHRDPWDRLLIAQARIEKLILITRDDEIRRSGAETIW